MELLKQAEWMDKMLIERVENVMDEWPTFIGFIEVLRRLNFFSNVDELIDYLKYPTKREKIFVTWTECGSPITEGTKSWSIFVDAVKNMKGIGDGRKDREET